MLNCLPDEKNWQEQRFPGIFVHNANIINSEYVIFAKDSTENIVVLKSTDSESWQVIETGYKGYIRYLNNRYIIDSWDSTFNQKVFKTSMDLTNWVTITANTNTNFNLIAFDGANYVGFKNSSLMQSPDLVNWSEPIPGNLDINFAYISYLDHQYYAFYNSDMNNYKIYYSPDAINWSEVNIFKGYSIWGMDFACNELIFTGNDGAIFKKENGNWVNHSILFGPNFEGVARGRNEFVFIGNHYGQEDPVLWSTSDFFIWKESKHSITSKYHGFQDEYFATYFDILYTGDFYIVTANECLNGECEGIILTAE
jgi:hypothetical protein